LDSNFSRLIPEIGYVNELTLTGFVERIMDMRLVIDNISKIRHAEFDFRGITVIAGNNNIGKSTVGKVLFSSFNSLCNIGEKVKRQR